MAGDQAARGRDRWPGGCLPPVVRPGGQHDPLLHRQAQEVVPHVQELRHHQHLEFQMDLRRDQCLRSIETLNDYHIARITHVSAMIAIFFAADTKGIRILVAPSCMPPSADTSIPL